MKLVIVEYPDSVNIQALPKGTIVTVTDGTTSLPNGSIMSLADVQDPEPAPHTHAASIGPPV